MTSEEAMMVAVQGDRAQLKDLKPALSALYERVRQLENEKTHAFTSRLSVAVPNAAMALAVHALVEEAIAAHEVHGPLLNAHHFKGVFDEEFEELWDEVKLKEEQRDPLKMKTEATQAAAVLLRFVLDCCAKTFKPEVEPLEGGIIKCAGPVRAIIGEPGGCQGGAR